METPACIECKHFLRFKGNAYCTRRSHGRNQVLGTYTFNRCQYERDKFIVEPGGVTEKTKCGHQGFHFEPENKLIVMWRKLKL